MPYFRTASARLQQRLGETEICTLSGPQRPEPHTIQLLATQDRLALGMIYGAPVLHIMSARSTAYVEVVGDSYAPHSNEPTEAYSVCCARRCPACIP